MCVFVHVTPHRPIAQLKMMYNKMYVKGWSGETGAGRREGGDDADLGLLEMIICHNLFIILFLLLDLVFSSLQAIANLMAFPGQYCMVLR